MRGLEELYSNYPSFNLPFIIYCLNVSLTGLIQTGLWLHISSPGRDLSYAIAWQDRRYSLLRGAVVPGVFMLSSVLVLVNPWLARGFFISLFVFQRLINRQYMATGKH